MRGTLGTRRVRPILADRSVELAKREAPVDAMLGRPVVRDRLGRAAVGCKADVGVEVLPCREQHRAAVAVELHSVLLVLVLDVEVRSEPRDRPGLELDDRDDAVGGADLERRGVERHSVGQQAPAPSCDAPRRPEERDQDRQWVDADIEQRPDRVEGLRTRVPGLDPPVIHVCVHEPDLARTPFLDCSVRGLLRLAHERDRRAAEPEPGAVGEVDERLRSGGVEGDWLLRVHMLPGLERPPRHLGVELERRQVDDAVHPTVREQVVERRQHLPAPFPGQRSRAPGVGVGHRHDRHVRIRLERPSVALRHVAAPNDPEPEHAASLARSGATLSASALLAQLVEHLHGKEGVDGSSPSEGFSKVPANRHFVVVCVLNTRTHSGHICGTRDAPRRLAASSDTS